MSISARSEQRKGTLSENVQIKDHFRCLITVRSIGIARRGLKEHIFVKTTDNPRVG